MRRPASLLLVSLLIVSCAAPVPQPQPVPAPAPAPRPVPAAPAQERVLRTVRVTASALNVRAEASAEADVVAQVRRGTALEVLAEGQSWLRVRVAGGEVGWVAARFVSSGGGAAAAPKRRAGGCPPDSDYAFEKAPTPSFSEGGAHGMVVVEANVNASGVVTKTRVVSNSTGDHSLAFLAEREIRGARFSPPIRNCVPRAFIFTYRRAF